MSNLLLYYSVWYTCTRIPLAMLVCNVATSELRDYDLYELFLRYLLIATPGVGDATIARYVIDRRNNILG